MPAMLHSTAPMVLASQTSLQLTSQSQALLPTPKQPEPCLMVPCHSPRD